MAKSRFGLQPADIGQLSLLPDVPDVEIPATLETEFSDDRNQHTDAARTPDPRTLESLPAGDGPEVDRANRLGQAIYAAQELTGDLLYDFTVVQKMDYQPAWEIATREWAFLPDEEDQPRLSFDPASPDPFRPLPATSE
jgi:hypothetical protein